MSSEKNDNNTAPPQKPKCEPCASLNKSALLSPEQISSKLQSSLPLWTLTTTTDQIPTITRTFTAKNFQSALDSINAFGAIAEREGHHPDFHLTGYRNVSIVLYTHKLGGVTENDVVLAKMFDEEVEVGYSPKWLKEHPAAQKK